MSTIKLLVYAPGNGADVYIGEKWEFAVLQAHVAVEPDVDVVTIEPKYFNPRMVPSEARALAEILLYAAEIADEMQEHVRTRREEVEEGA